MKKTPKTHTLSNKTTIFISISLFLFVILPLSIFAYIKLLDYQDAQKFQSLKADMLALQTEFNKIMPGWEYEEGCWGGGGPYNVREAQGCNVSITKKQVDGFDAEILSRLANEVQRSHMMNVVKQDTYLFEGNRYLSITYTYARLGSVQCSLRLPMIRPQLSAAPENGSVRCGSSARDFHFKDVGA